MSSIENKKLMILGASYSQVPLFRAARRLGVKTVAASIPGKYQGFAEADEIAYVDITDPEAVLKAAQEAEIDGAATCCMDVGTRALGYICEKMNLPGMNIFSSEASCNKAVEKEAYLKCGVNTAKYFKLHNEIELKEAIDKLTFPVMMKAVDLMGSRGIYRCNTKEEAILNYQKTMEETGKDYCIIEEFIDGTMFGVEAMVSGGKIAYYLPLGNVMHQGNPSFPIGHYVPWEYDQKLHEKIGEQVQKVVDALGYDNCPMDMDCMLKDDQIYIIEATGRAGATAITDTVSIYYGFDYFEAIVKVALGEDVTDLFTGPSVPHMPSVTRLLSAPKKGVVQSIEIPKHLPDNVVDLSFNVEKGSAVQPITNGRDRIGQLIVKGSTLPECFGTMDSVMNEIKLDIEEE